MAAGTFNFKRRKHSNPFGKRRNQNKRGMEVIPWENAMPTWVDARAHIKSFDGNVYDVTNDIVSGTITRGIDVPMSLSINIANSKDKYRQLFIPGDQIVVWLRRDQNEYQAFTGYIKKTPMHRLVTQQEISLEAECLIRRFKTKYFDPNLPENVIALSSGFGEKDQLISPDQTLAFLLTAPDYVGLDPKNVFIQRFPLIWIDRANKISNQNKGCTQTWDVLINCDDPCGSSGDVGDGGVSTEGCPEGATIGSIIDETGWPEEEKERAAAIMFCESGGRAAVINDSTAGIAAGTPVGLFQITPQTALEVDSTSNAEKLKDPLYNSTIARKLWEIFAWTKWECWSTGKWRQDVGREDTPITGCTPTDPENPEEESEEDAAYRPALTPVGSGPGSGSKNGFGDFYTLGVEKPSRISVDYMRGGSTVQKPNRGVDVEALRGSNIRAWGNGKVMSTGKNKTFNTYLIAKIGDHYVLFGNIMKEQHLSEGTNIHTGDILGKVGSKRENNSRVPFTHIQVFSNKQAALDLDSRHTLDPKMVYYGETDITAPIRLSETPQINQTENTMISVIYKKDGPEAQDVATVAAEGSYTDYEVSIVRLINGYRKKKGLSSLKINAKMSVASDRHNRDMIKYNFRGHDTVQSDYYPSGAKPWDRMSSEGYNTSAGSGENLSYGHGTPQEALQGWKDSPPHNELMLNPDMKVIGVDYKDGTVLNFGNGVWGTTYGVFVEGNEQEVGADAEGGEGEREENLDQMVEDGLQARCQEYEWGGGHDEEGESSENEEPTEGEEGEGEGDDSEEDSAFKGGVDASGLFNRLRRKQGLVPGEIGSVADWFEFLVNKEPFRENKAYPVGTILINPGDENTIPHMAMVIDEDGTVLDVNAHRRVVNTDFKYWESNQGWTGYTHAGEMPDVKARKPSLNIVSPDVPQGHYPTNNPQFSGVATSQDVKTSAVSLSPNAQKLNDIISKKFNTPAPYTYSGHDAQQGDQNAMDYLFSSWGEPASGDGKKTADELVGFLETNFDAFDLWVIAWWGQRYTGSGWEPHTGRSQNGDPDTAAHRDHVHITLKNGGTIGEYKDDGKTFDPGNIEGAGDGSGSDSAYDEPCIMKNPLGVYRLWNSLDDTIYSTTVRRLALGLEIHPTEERQREQWELLGYPDEAYLNDINTEIRDWSQLAEINKEPYMKTVQDVASSGLYSMQSLGTGEVVFWYPDIMYGIEDYVLKQLDEKIEESEEDLSDMEKGLAELNVDEQKLKEEIAQKEKDLKRAEENSSGPAGEGLVALERNRLRKKRQEYQDLKEKIGRMEIHIQDLKNQKEARMDFDGTPFDQTNVNMLLKTMILKDIELIDFHLYVSDEELVTHYYCAGDFQMEGSFSDTPPFLPCWRWSTIFTHPFFQMKSEQEGLQWNPRAFLQKYGSRPKKETVNAIKTPGMAQIWADYEFFKQWLKCYTIDLKTAFLPELYPGQTLEVESLGVKVHIIDVSHSFGNKWETNVSCSMPLAEGDSITDTEIPPLPFWSLIPTSYLEEYEGETPDVPSPDEEYITSPIPEGELYDALQEKREKDREVVRDYLYQWQLVENLGMVPRDDLNRSRDRGLDQ